jgi:hypothetical protein
MPKVPDLFAELRLRLEARKRIEQLAREGLEHQQDGRLDEAKECLRQAEEIEARLRALRDR